jgi:2-C-methyl-D-erythritol 4-phosphate cytidylyltransferase
VSKVQFALIIPAAGSGKRIGAEVAKPYLRIAGKTIIEHTICKFASISGLAQVIIATTPEYFNDASAVKNLLPEEVDVRVIEGGKERQDSIYQALQIVGESVELVAIHDAVRPFVSEDSVYDCLSLANESGAAILGLPVKDTIKRVDSKGLILETPERSRLWKAQTPQIFRQSLIRKAYEKAVRENFLGTDDASLVEYYGKNVFVTEGDQQNFKITYPLDLRVAELLLTEESGKS